MNAAGVGLIVASLFLTAFFMPNYWIHFALTVALGSIIRAKVAASAGSGDSPSRRGSGSLPYVRHRGTP
jgi:hypothetical protein